MRFSAQWLSYRISFQGAAGLLGLFFFLLAALAWFRFLEGSPRGFLEALLFQQAALLSREVAVVFPFLAFGLTWIFKRDSKERNHILLRTIPLFLIVDLLTFFLLTKDFWSSQVLVSRKISLLPVPYVLLKWASLVHMLVLPVLTWKKGSSPFAVLDFSFLGLFPLFFILLAGSVLLWRKKILFSLFNEVPRELLAAGVLWIVITILPHMPHPLVFQRASRYVLYPAAGFSILLGFFLARFFELLRHSYGRWGWIFYPLLLGSIVTVHLQNLSFQYARYQRYLQDHPKEDFTARVERLLVQ